MSQTVQGTKVEESSATAAASSAQGEFPAAGVLTGNRFSFQAGDAWKGAPEAPGWWWEVRFPEERQIGAILQVLGDDELCFRNAPREYVWSISTDGVTWRELLETSVSKEKRAYRLHRLHEPVRARFLRLTVYAAQGAYPTLRAVEVYPEPDAVVPFPEWAVIVSTTTRYEPLGAGRDFLPLARETAGGAELQAQNIWLGDLAEVFLAVEPHPLCVFLSGNFRDWCQVEREPWRGVQNVVREGNIPMWAACGGAQGLALLAEYGVDQEWDCPHCRDPHHPKSPIYGHIGHAESEQGEQLPCGDYSACLAERGPNQIRPIARDPVFQGLPEEFTLIESHCGQIEWAPRGWQMVAVGGEGAKTRTQCLRVEDRYIYAAQFHIEMAGTPENSRRVMENFLSVAREWGGYRPGRALVEAPSPLGL